MIHVKKKAKAVSISAGEIKNILGNTLYNTTTVLLHKNSHKYLGGSLYNLSVYVCTDLLKILNLEKVFVCTVGWWN